MVEKLIKLKERHKQQAVFPKVYSVTLA